MAGYIQNMASGQATQAMAPKPAASSPYDPSKPWEYSFSAGLANPSVPQRALSFSRGYQQGPNGFGIYQGHSAEQNALGAQQHYTQAFKEEMPHLNDLLTGQLGNQINQNMGKGIENSKIADNRRGLLYGGVHQGNEESLRGNAASQMAQGKSDINSGLMNTYEGTQNSTIKTGVDWQQQQQAMQNSIYQNALANMMNTNSAIGSAFGAAGMVGGAYAGGMFGGPTGALVGAQVGNTAGKQVG